MEIYTIRGGRPLAGTIRPKAAKNSVLPLLAATLLCDGPCTLKNVPRLRDVDTSLVLMTQIGAKAVRDGTELHTLPAGRLYGKIPAEQAGAMRSSVFYLAPVLTRTGAVHLPLPGGCRLGPRPVDIHLAGLAAMGAQVFTDGKSVSLTCAGRLHGADFTLRLPSVGATETLLMAAACAQGTTVLRGAACEPEILDLAAFLSACGCEVHGAGTPVIVVHGQNALRGVTYTPLPDRIAASTYAAAAAAVGGSVTVENCRPEHFATFLDFLRAVGCEVHTEGDRVCVQRDPEQPLRGGQEICAAAYPGFATDAAPLAAAVLLTAQGASHVYDGLFQDRFACAEGFAALGAQVTRSGRSLTISGGAQLKGTKVKAPDLRGGAALVLAALAAQGTTELTDDGHIRRGYEDPARDLRRLGADCTVK